MKVSLDAGGLYQGIERLLPYVDILIPSAEFALGLTGKTEIGAAMSALKEKYSPEILVVTDGRNGGYYWQNGQAEHYDSVKIKAVDTNSAGDTFHGAFIAAYCYGKTLQECCVYKVGLAKLVNRYKKCEELLEKFYLTFKCLWFKENKP